MTNVKKCYLFTYITINIQVYVTAAQAEGHRGVTHTDTMLLGNKGRARIHKKKDKTDVR